MGALNRGELVAGVADEHAGLPDGPIADRDALDELGDRARRRRCRRAHRSHCRRCTSQPHLPGFTATPAPPSFQPVVAAGSSVPA